MMSQIRNFCIISHIDHGKSTLADRFLEMTGVIEKRKMQPQYLDMMELEREKGITIKMQPVRMAYGPYILNLIDTPGHVDFSYEVSRSLAAVEGAILLVDATKGIQAQTLANLNLAKKQNLVIIPVVNKIDLAQARVEEAVKDMAELLGIDKNRIIKISAKYGTNVDQVLERVFGEVPSPKGGTENPLRALIFDSEYDPYKGVVAYVRLIDGRLANGENIFLIRGQAASEVKELGYFKPEFSPQKELLAGEIGYVATGIKEPGKVRVGDTITKLKNKNDATLKLKIIEVEPLAGYQEPKSMVFADLYPENPDDYDSFKTALAKLKLNDASFTFEPRPGTVLGRGFHCGFLGMLHIEIISERLRREFSLTPRISSPTVIYRIIDKKGVVSFISSAADWPESFQIQEVQEPLVKLEVITPNAYFGKVLEILKELRGKHIETKYFGSDSVILVYEAPLREVIIDFYDKLKSSTQGYASMNYKILNYQLSDLVKLDIFIAEKEEGALSKIVPKDSIEQEGRKIVKKLKELLPPQQFSVSLQAAVGGKIIARETMKARRKDVTAPLYGGDYTRKRKLLEKQKKGKKKLKERGRVSIPAEVYLKILTKS